MCWLPVTAQGSYTQAEPCQALPSSAAAQVATEIAKLTKWSLSMLAGGSRRAHGAGGDKKTVHTATLSAEELFTKPDSCCSAGLNAIKLHYSGTWLPRCLPEQLQQPQRRTAAGGGHSRLHIRRTHPAHVIVRRPSGRPYMTLPQLTWRNRMLHSTAPQPSQRRSTTAAHHGSHTAKHGVSC